MTKKRLAIVTGGSRGIGLGIVMALEKQGCKVVAMGMNENRLKELKEMADKEGLDILTECFNITDFETITATFERLADEHGGISILVNNAGITRDGLVVTISDDDFDDVMAVNLKAAFVATRAATKSMMRNRFGRIINITSVSGVIGNAGQSNYAASKAALVGMSKCVAREFAKRNITVNCVAPGFITTDMTDVLPDKAKDYAKSAIPMNKFGKVEDIANAVAFFASDEASYVTGQLLCVDGGMAM